MHERRRSSATRRSQHPRCVLPRPASATSRATRRRWSSEICGISPGADFLRGRRDADRELRPRAHDRALLRRRLDAAHRRRADDPRRRDPAAAARQHRPPRRRHPGAARPRVDPGLDRHPDALRPAARLPARCRTRREGELDLETYVDSGGADRGWWSNFDKYIVSLLKAWFGDAATEENDYGFGRLPKITGNHSHFPTMLRALDGGARRPLRDGPEPGGRLAARGAAAAGAGEAEVARGPRPVRDRDRDVLARRARGAAPASCAPRTSRPRSS